GVAAAAGRAAREVVGEVFRRQRDPRRAAVDHAADRRPVRLAEGGDPQQRAEGVQNRLPAPAAAGTAAAPSRTCASRLMRALWATRSRRSATNTPICPTLNSTQASGRS